MSVYWEVPVTGRRRAGSHVSTQAKRKFKHKHIKAQEKHMWTGVTQAEAQAQEKGTFSFFLCFRFSVCVVPVHTYLELALILMLASYVWTDLNSTSYSDCGRTLRFPQWKQPPFSLSPLYTFLSLEMFLGFKQVFHIEANSLVICGRWFESSCVFFTTFWRGTWTVVLMF